MTRTLRRDVASLRERLAATIATSVNVLPIEIIDAQGCAQQTLGYNVANLRVWVPAADGVALVELIARPGLFILMAADAPAEGHVALPARDPGESLATYAERCRELVP